MSESILLVLAVVVVVAGLVAGGLQWRARRRKARFANDPKARQREARRAIEEMAKKRRGKKGTIRGEGGGGNNRTAQEAGFGTDFSGGI
ncbi:hypothetical protein ACWER9_21715 [Micromonospora sp. NPDC003944]